MRDDIEDDAPDKTPRSERESGRKPYRPPKLTVYGDLPRLVAMAKPGSRSDGAGKPKTKQ
jgi:hypothetical protein